MTNEQLKAIRERSGLTPADFGRKLGWKGSDSSIRRALRLYENGERPIPARIILLLLHLDKISRKSVWG